MLAWNTSEYCYFLLCNLRPFPLPSQSRSIMVIHFVQSPDFSKSTFCDFSQPANEHTIAWKVNWKRKEHFFSQEAQVAPALQSPCSVVQVPKEVELFS